VSAYFFLSKKMIVIYDWQIQEIGEPSKEAKIALTVPNQNMNGTKNYLFRT
jgi:hypothetical protein